MLLEKILENLAINVRAFATCGVASGWRLLLPKLDGITLHFVVQGNGAIKDAEGTVHPLPRYSLAVIPPGTIHAIECGEQVGNETRIEGGAPPKPGLPEYTAGASGQLEFISACGQIQVTYGGGLGLFDMLREVLVVEFEDLGQMRATFDSVLKEREVGGSATAIMMSALMTQCLVLLFRRLTDHPDCKLPWLAALDDPSLGRALDAIMNQPEAGHTVESLAELASMSRSVFARRFQDSFNRTPLNYVREVRLRKAAKLLQSTDISVDAIASKVGFNSRSHFSQAFSQQFTLTPSKFRMSPAGEGAAATGT